MKPVYFDLTVRDLREACRFFETVFGWRCERFAMRHGHDATGEST